MRKLLPILLIIFTVGCAHREVVKEFPSDPALLTKAQDLYTFLLNREIGIKHNDQDQELRKYFLDTQSYYDFMDSLLYVMRNRNINRNTISRYYIQSVKIGENGDSATVEVKLLSRDTYMAYRKINATQYWEKTYDTWYPRKIEAPKLNWFQKITGTYAVPPIH